METNIEKNTGGRKMNNRILIGTPTRGLMRAEWVGARYGQTIPCNWSYVEYLQWMSQYMPTEYQIADAENLLAKAVVEGNFEWFFSLEEDNILPPDTFIKLNDYMINGYDGMGTIAPVVSGIYFTKSVPTEPILYRGRGNGYYADWKMGDKVWVDGLPFGCTLIHGNIIRELWKVSPEYIVPGTNTVTRRVFDFPSNPHQDPTKAFTRTQGTTDLAFYTRIIKENILEKAGFKQFQDMEFPFLIDTTIFVKHIDQNGVQYPLEIPKRFIKMKEDTKEELPTLGIRVEDKVNISDKVN